MAADQIALTYVHPDGSPRAGEYPFNPNGSLLDIAGICNPRGNVLGLMPHPENHIHPGSIRFMREGCAAAAVWRCSRTVYATLREFSYPVVRLFGCSV